MTTCRDPDSEGLDGALGTLSMRDKSLLKRSINRHHNNNISAGYVPVHEEALGRTGLRGRKTYLFWSVVGLLCLLAWANMVVTLVIFKVLRMGGLGPGALEILPGSLKLKATADLGHLLKPDGAIEGFKGEPLDIGGPVSLEALDAKGRPTAGLSVGRNGSWVRGVAGGLRVGPAGSPPVFATARPAFRLPRGLRHAQARAAKTTRIASPLDQKLLLRSESFASLKGSEGTKLEGKEIVWSADQVVTLKSTNGSIILGGKDGITLDVKSIPIVGGPGAPLAAQYKVCVCMPQGLLFRVPVSTDYSSHIACHDIDQSKLNNPCM